MKIALLEASHWHVHLYLDAIERSGASLVAVSDSDHFGGEKVAARFGTKIYDDYRELLAKENVDFVFAFGRHVAMPSIANALIEKNIPFAIEKPCGLNLNDVSSLRREAERRGLYVAVPYIFRGSDLFKEIAKASGGKLSHISFRNCAGPPSRYPAVGCGWMLEKSQSGGGCTMNLAGHFIDMVLALSGSKVRSVSAVMSDRLHGSGIEDYSSITLQCENGVLGLVETGYSFPSSPQEQREVSFTVCSEASYIRSGNQEIHVRDRTSKSDRIIKVDYETDRYYAGFVETVLREFKNGRRSVPGLQEAEAMMQVLDAAYASAKDNGAVRILRD